MEKSDSDNLLRVFTENTPARVRAAHATIQNVPEFKETSERNFSSLRIFSTKRRHITMFLTPQSPW
jgi:hypothetical protein